MIRSISYEKLNKIQMPDLIYFNRIKPEAIENGKIIDKLPYAGVLYKEYIISFAKSIDLVVGGKKISSLQGSYSVSTEDFINKPKICGFSNEKDAKNILVQLLRLCWEYFAKASGLSTYYMSEHVKAFYGTEQVYGKNRLSFGNGDGKIRRSLVGYKSVLGAGKIKKKRFWHFALSVRPVLWPYYAYTIRTHVAFSEDGITAWSDSGRMHKARRSQCKDWWNDDWRDRMLCMMYWLGNGNEEICITVSSNTKLTVCCKPITFLSPVSYLEPTGRTLMSLDEREDESMDLEESEDEDTSL